MEAARPRGVADGRDRGVEPLAVEHRAGHEVARHADRPILGAHVTDSLDETRSVDGERMAGKQAGGAKAHESGAVVRAHVDDTAMAVEDGVVVFVVRDEAGPRAPRRDHQRRAAGRLRTAHPIAASRKISPTVPEEHGVERDTGAVGDPLDLAHVPRPHGPGRGFE